MTLPLRSRIALLVLLTFVFLLPVVSRAAIIHEAVGNGLVGYWNFNEGTSTAAHDFSGRGNTGTLTNTPIWASGKLGKGLQFNSTNWVTMGQPLSLKITGSFTASLWVKTTTVAQGGFISRWYNVPGSRSFRSFTGNGLGLQLNLSSDGTAVFVCTSSTGAALNDNRWHHVVAVYNASATTVTLYEDGASVGSCSSAPASLFENGRAIQIGTADTDTAANSLTGSVDEVRIYNRALSQSEITGLYWAGLAVVNTSSVNNAKASSLSTGLVGWWTMDGGDTLWTSGTAGNEVDKSGTMNTGTLTGMIRSGSPAAGKIGQALKFDGSGAYITTPTQSISGTVAVSAWVYSTNFSQNGFVIGKNPVNTQWELFFEGPLLKWRGGNTTSVNCTVPSNNTWHHVVGMQSGVTATIYIDGVQCVTGTVTAIGNGAGTIDIGRFDANYYFNGKIDDVRLYTRILTASEVKQLYLQGGGVSVNASSQNLDNGSTAGTGLVGLWTLNGADLTDKIYDRSGSAHNAYFSSTTPATSTMKVAGQLGQAVRFSGSAAQFFTAGGFTDLGTSNRAYTLSAWVKPASSLATGDVIHMSDGVAGTGWCISPLQVKSGKATSLSWNGGGPVTASSTTILLPNKWYHIVSTWDATNGLRIFVNGILESSTAQGAYGASGGSNFIFVGSPYLGASCSTDAGSGFAGSIDDVRIYNRALSTSEVKQLYSVGK